MSRGPEADLDRSPSSVLAGHRSKGPASHGISSRSDTVEALLDVLRMRLLARLATADEVRLLVRRHGGMSLLGTIDSRSACWAKECLGAEPEIRCGFAAPSESVLENRRHET